MANVALIRESLISMQNMPEALHEFDELVEQYEEIDRCFDSSTRSYESEIKRLREALTWIKDPSYIETFSPAQVINTYRMWAEIALDPRVAARKDV